MRKTLLLAATALLVAALPAAAAPPQAPDADLEAIRAVALDYIEGWYTADAERMARAVHPDLVKRIVGVHPETGETLIQETGAEELVEQTRRGGGSSTPEADRRTDVEVLDVFGDTASVRITAGDWIDYLHVARFGDEYEIVNILWELTPQAKERMRAGQQ